MSEKKFCLDLTFEDLKEWCNNNSLPKFRAKQIYTWLSSGVIDLNSMNNIPKTIRTLLDESFYFNGSSVNNHDAMTVVNKFVSKIDGTTKFVYELFDGHIIETVLMWYKTGVSICISSQAGCKMGCTFCASAHAGFGRSLTSGEMLGQIVLSQHLIGERIRSVVVMGIGEPFDNYDNLLGFLKLSNDPEGLNLGSRHITISTCGLIPRMKEFTALNLQVNLSVSLHATNDELRKRLMPIANKYSIDELMATCREYTNKTKRRITFEYSLFDNVNDSIEVAVALSKLLKGMLCHVNLIVANEFEGSPYKRSPDKRVKEFKKALENLNVNATLRREMGTDIMAACGQLRRGMEGGVISGV